MALSKPIIPESPQDVPEIGQHYVECGTEHCNKNCQFYCNPCHRPMCQQCRDEHLKSPDTKTHEVVLYRQRMRQLPVQKCKDHPTKDIDMRCDDCQVLICSKCAARNHRGHMITDLEEVYSKKFTQCLEEIYKIHRYFLPTTEGIQKEIKEDATEMKTFLEKIRTSMKREADTLKNLVDEVVSKKLKEVDKIEESIMEMLQRQDKIYRGYISYLNDVVKEFNGHLSAETLELISITDAKLEIQPIPETSKPVAPVFTTGQHNEDNVIKLFGQVKIPTTKPKTRTIKAMEIHSEEVKTTEKQMHEDVPTTKPDTKTIKAMESHSAKAKPTETQTNQENEKSDGKYTLSISSFVTKVNEYKVPGVGSVFHVSLSKSGRLWVSDNKGNLVQTDLQGNLLQKLKTSVECSGYHTNTQNGDFIHADRNNSVINKITMDDNEVTEFIKTGGWKPVSIHSSRISGDILVGMRKDKEAKVTRYNKTGQEIQNIQRDNKGQELYSEPHYITENMNGDICTSDFMKHAVVVVNKSGQYRFSYTGQRSVLYPWGLCTDVLGHILVCEFSTDTVHLLNKDGEFLRFILTKQQGLYRPCSVCMDDENTLYVGQISSIVRVFKYLK